MLNEFSQITMYDLIDIPKNYTDPAIEYIRHKDRYTIKGKRKGYHIANGYVKYRYYLQNSIKLMNKSELK